MNYHNITNIDMLNGDGLRVVLWLSGCPHRCKGCQNPQTWNYKSGIKFDKNAYEELINYLSQDYINGLTLSGGDPLAGPNYKPVLSLVKHIKSLFPNKTIWIYTGYTMKELLYMDKIDILEYIDVLVDGEFKIKLKDNTLHWKGSSNQNIWRKEKKQWRIKN